MKKNAIICIWNACNSKLNPSLQNEWNVSNCSIWLYPHAIIEIITCKASTYQWAQVSLMVHCFTMGNIVYVIAFIRRNPPPPFATMCFGFNLRLNLWFWIDFLFFLDFFQLVGIGGFYLTMNSECVSCAR
jgi:hypothetical protein